MSRLLLIGLVVLLISFGVGWQLAVVNKQGMAKDLPVESLETTETLPVQGGSGGSRGSLDVNLLARVVAAEAQGEPYEGQVAVAAVLLNRINSPSFPNSLAGVVYQPLAFESVMNGLIWRVSDLSTAQRAAAAALNGWDPTYGSLYFWNPSKPVSPWIWTRRIVRFIGDHVFGH